MDAKELLKQITSLDPDRRVRVGAESACRAGYAPPALSSADQPGNCRGTCTDALASTLAEAEAQAAGPAADNGRTVTRLLIVNPRPNQEDVNPQGWGKAWPKAET